VTRPLRRRIELAPRPPDLEPVPPTPTDDEDARRSLVRRIAIANYKSIARCVVDLGPLTFLVGPNGSGKSNFLDALRFVADSLNTTVEQALRDRGGIQSVRRHSRGHPTHFGIRVEVEFPEQRIGTYAFRISAKRDGGFSVQREECWIRGILEPENYFVVEEGRVLESSTVIRSATEADRLALVNISGLREFRPMYDVLRGMTFYNLNPERIRDLQDPDPGHVLLRDGRNLAAVIRELSRLDKGRVLSEVSAHLRAVVPGVESVQHRPIGPKETIEFKQEVAGDQFPWRFPAANMSDGTLRALGILTAVFQSTVRRRVSFVGIEEPEMALHPGAVEVVAVALMRASRYVQVLATTHSPDLLDHKDIREEHLLAVSADRGETIIGPVNAAVRSALRDRLYSTGELLRMGQLEPDKEIAAETSRQMKLFD
jgi:predicted ATPase